MNTTKIARTWLFVPADKIDKIPKAFASGADQVIIDLEDAVAHSHKNQARRHLQDYHDSSDYQPVWLRINQADSQHFFADIKACQELKNLAGIILPKAENANDIERVRHSTGLPVIALIETAKGLYQISQMAKAHGLITFSYGFLDLCHELNIQPNTQSATIIANQIRYQLLLTCRANQLQPPIDSVFPDFHDETGLKQRVQLWANMGMSGMLCIHPKQISTIHQALIKSDEDIEFAQKVVDFYQKTGQITFQIEGEMVDLPVIHRCEALLNNQSNP